MTAQPDIEQISVKISRDLVNFIREQVAEGNYADADAVVASALDGLQRQENDEDGLSPEGEAALRRGIEQAERGELIDFEEIRAYWRARIKSQEL